MLPEHWALRSLLAGLCLDSPPSAHALARLAMCGGQRERELFPGWSPVISPGASRCCRDLGPEFSRCPGLMLERGGQKLQRRWALPGSRGRATTQRGVVGWEAAELIISSDEP